MPAVSVFPPATTAPAIPFPRRMRKTRPVLPAGKVSCNQPFTTARTVRKFASTRPVYAISVSAPARMFALGAFATHCFWSGALIARSLSPVRQLGFDRSQVHSAVGCGRDLLHGQAVVGKF